MSNPSNQISDAPAQSPLSLRAGQVRFEQCGRTASRVIDGKAIVITIDSNQLHVLNDVGTRVWQLADGRTLEAIVDAIVDEFDVDREQASLDVCRFAEQLLAIGAAQIPKASE